MCIIDEIIPLLIPIIEEVGKGTVSKIGEDIWNLIKKTFSTKRENINNLNTESIRSILEEILKENPKLNDDIKLLLKTSNLVQNINNTGATIEMRWSYIHYRGLYVSAFKVWGYGAL